MAKGSKRLATDENKAQTKLGLSLQRPAGSRIVVKDLETTSNSTDFIR